MRKKDTAPRRATYDILGMIQRVMANVDIPHQIVQRVTRALKPTRIILFGSRARGDARGHSDWDVYVEIDGRDDDALKKAEDVIRDLFWDDDWTLDVHARAIGAIERRRDDPGTIEWDVAREGIVLYAALHATPLVAPPDRVREPRAGPPESVDEWLRVAEVDLRHRNLLLSAADDFWAQICWLSHQTCEKFMKALLVSRRVRPERTHKLPRLLKALRAAGVPLSGLDADCKLLTKHAVTPRYLAGLKLGEADARTAAAAADRVIRAVRAHLS
jgi:HEPN domain-containing protein/predicted nucleotidyltransferase